MLVLVLVLGGAWLLMGLGCGEYSDTVGSDIVDNDLSGTTKEAWFPMDRAAVMNVGDVIKSTPRTLYIGQQAGVTSDILIQFTDFASLMDSVIEVQDVQLYLYGLGVADTNSIQDTTTWNALLYRVDSEWEYIDLKYDAALETTFLDTLEGFGSYKLLQTSEDDTVSNIDTVIVPIDSTTFYGWLLDTLTYGLRIKPVEGAGFLKKFQSRYNATDAGLIPALHVTGSFLDISGSDTTLYADTTLYVYSVITTFLTNDTTTVPDSLLYLQEGYGRNMLLWQDLAGYFEDSLGLGSDQLSLNKAELFMRLSPDSGRMILDGMAMSIYDVEEEWFNDPDSTQLGAVSTSQYALPSDTSMLRIDITPLARKWETFPDNNYGMAIKAYNQSARLGRSIFYSVDADSAHRPWVRVIYTEYDEP